MQEMMPRTLHDTAPLFEQHEKGASGCRQRRTDQSHKHTGGIFIDDEHFHSRSRVLVAFSFASFSPPALGVWVILTYHPPSPCGAQLGRTGTGRFVPKRLRGVRERSSVEKGKDALSLLSSSLRNERERHTGAQ